MKLNKIFVSFLFLVAVVSVSCKKNVTNELGSKTENTSNIATENTTNSQTVTKKFMIEGMSCSKSCSPKIKSDLQKLKGVKSAVVSFELKSAVVSFDSSQTNEKNIIATVEGIAGGIYKVVSVVEPTLAECNKPCCANKEVEVSKPDCVKPCCKQTEPLKTASNCNKPCCIDKNGGQKACKPSSDGKQKTCCKNKST